MTQAIRTICALSIFLGIAEQLNVEGSVKRVTRVLSSIILILSISYSSLSHYDPAVYDLAVYDFTASDPAVYDSAVYDSAVYVLMIFIVYVRFSLYYTGIRRNIIREISYFQQRTSAFLLCRAAPGCAGLFPAVLGSAVLFLAVPGCCCAVPCTEFKMLTACSLYLHIRFQEILFLVVNSGPFKTSEPYCSRYLHLRLQEFMFLYENRSNYSNSHSNTLKTGYMIIITMKPMNDPEKLAGYLAETHYHDLFPRNLDQFAALCSAEDGDVLIRQGVVDPYQKVPAAPVDDILRFKPVKMIG